MANDVCCVSVSFVFGIAKNLSLKQHQQRRSEYTKISRPFLKFNTRANLYLRVSQLSNRGRPSAAEHVRTGAYDAQGFRRGARPEENFEGSL